MKQGRNSASRTDDRKASQGYIDVKSQTTQQLEELIERQNKLLQNRFFIAKLPDKGQKIVSFKGELEKELQRRQNCYNSACQLLSNLVLSDLKSEDIEWNKGNISSLKNQVNSVDISDGEVDPLTLIATHCGTATGLKMKQSFGVGEISLLLKEDRKIIKQSLYVDKVCEKYGKVTTVTDRFKPNQLKDNNTDVFSISAENVKKKLGDKWEVTEATPPVLLLKSTLVISLSESLRLQKEQAEILKEIEKKNAAEKLMRNRDIKMGDKLSIKNTADYRTAGNNFTESTEDESDEFEDSECEERVGGTFYNRADEF